MNKITKENKKNLISGDFNSNVLENNKYNKSIARKFKKKLHTELQLSLLT